LGCWRRFLSQQWNFPVGKEFLRQQLRSWLLGKRGAVGEAAVSCCVQLKIDDHAANFFYFFYGQRGESIPTPKDPVQGLQRVVLGD
jgi:hypothetical protein